MRSITIYDDYNIVKLYSDVITELDGYMKNKDNYRKEYERYKKIASQSHNPIDVDKATSIHIKMGRLLPMIEDGSIIQVCKDKLLKHIQAYKVLNGSNRMFGMDKCPCIPKRVGIIIQFMKDIADFTDITWTCSYDLSKYCPVCYGPLKKQSTMMICSCGHTHTVVKVPNISLEDGKICSKSTYKAPKNFRKEYMHLCGTLSSIIEGEESDIRSYLYRARIHNPTRQNIRDAMKECGYKNYNDVPMLSFKIADLPLPPILEHIDICTERFELYFVVFKVAKCDGQNISNIHFLIRLFLWQEGIPYEDDWFRELSSVTEKKHRSNAKKICTVLKEQEPDMNWNYPPEWDEDANIK